jgi:hypothetical protein
MLVCLNHSKLPDGKNKNDYSVQDLKKYKQKHEDRIRRQTNLQPEMTTTVLRFIANIGDRPVSISRTTTYEAILPRFPADDRGILIDFTNRPGRGEANYWDSLISDISLQINRELTAGHDRPRPDHISIFALGPIPALVKVGYDVGNAIAADIFQFHRDTNDWKWKDETDEKFEYSLDEKLVGNSKHVALVLSLSGKIHQDEVNKIFEEAPDLYEISFNNPNPAFLRQRKHLQSFRNLYRGLLTKIREKYSKEVVIHLFPAIPAPIAVLCGRELLPKSDPTIIIYDHEKEQGGFIKTITIN